MSLNNTETLTESVLSKPINAEKLTISDLDNLQIHFIFSTGRSGSTLLPFILQMHDHVSMASEEYFAVSLAPKYEHIKNWTKDIIHQYANDFILFSDGKLFPLFAGKDFMIALLSQFQEHLTYERVIKLSYLCFASNKDLTQLKVVIDKQLRYYLLKEYIRLFPNSKFIFLCRDARDNIYSKYNKALRKKRKPTTCWDIYTWLYTYKEYLKYPQIKQQSFLLQYEKLIQHPESTLHELSEFLNIEYTPHFLDYYLQAELIFNSIQNPKVKEHFSIMHKSLTQPINPEKIDEWRKNMHRPEIKNLCDTTWKITEKANSAFGYIAHDNYDSNTKSTPCIIERLKIKLSLLVSRSYFSYTPFFIRRFIKLKLYKHRINKNTIFDAYLR